MANNEGHSEYLYPDEIPARKTLINNHNEQINTLLFKLCSLITSRKVNYITEASLPPD